MDLYYEMQGEGRPVVMIHSPGVDSREWRHVAPRLAEYRQAITFDCRGIGRSPAPTAPLNPVEDLRKLLAHLDIERTVLIGHSMGGQLATEFTLTYPSMVERLVLVAPSLTGFVYSQPFVEWMAGVHSLAPDVRRMVEYSLTGPNYRVAMASPHRDFLLEMHTQYMTRMLTEWQSHDIIWPQPPAIERLEEIAADTLFVQGTVEWADMRQVAEQFERVPRIRFADIEGADHMLTLTHAEELADRIRLFLQE